MQYRIINKAYRENFTVAPYVSPIINKHSTEYYAYLNGPREACEDTVCSECSNRKEGTYKQCKQTCFKEKASDISNCCMVTCQDRGKPLRECIEACNSPNIFN